MKKNTLKTMENLEIDTEIRGLVGQLWKHNYKTRFSCSGHNKPEYSYVVFMDQKGDGWFEKNADKYGLKEVEKKDCCETVQKIDEEFSKKYPGYFKTNFCWECGYAFNGMKKYEGTLIPDPFNPLNTNLK
jgi:hypothetical protein